MVRLLVPEGQGQHPLTRGISDPFPTQLDTLRIPIASVLFAGATTAVLALVGYSRPGYFLKATTYFSVVNLSVAGIEGYGQREVNRAVFQLDNIEPKSGKLWERTKHWTYEDMGIGGATLSTLVALNPRALPGVAGWRRFFGAATVGYMAGTFIGPPCFGLAHIPPQSLQVTRALRAHTMKIQYDRLKEDAKAYANLSRFGKIAFAFYTWPIWELSFDPFKATSEPGAGDWSGALGGEFQSVRVARDVYEGASEEEMEVSITLQNKEIKGPDIEDGYRAYNDRLADRDTHALNDWLRQLDETRKATATEAQYIWQCLAIKEHDFYTMEEEDTEKDMLRRQLQLLNSIGCDFILRDAILAYHIADLHKRLEQPGKQEPITHTLIKKMQAMPVELQPDWKTRHSPHLLAEQIRIIWSKQKMLLGYFEQDRSRFADIKPEPGSEQEKKLDIIKQHADFMKRNVEATGRLLKGFEDQIRRAEEYADAEKAKSAKT